MAYITRKGKKEYAGETFGEFKKRQKARVIASRLRSQGISAQEVGGELVTVSKPDTFNIVDPKTKKILKKNVSELDIVKIRAKEINRYEKAEREYQQALLRQGERSQQRTISDKNIKLYSDRGVQSLNLGFAEERLLPKEKEVTPKKYSPLQAMKFVESRGYSQANIERARRVLKKKRVVGETEESLAKKFYAGDLAKKERQKEALRKIELIEYKQKRFAEPQDKFLRKQIFRDKTYPSRLGYEIIRKLNPITFGVDIGAGYQKARLKQKSGLADYTKILRYSGQKELVKKAYPKIKRFGLAEKNIYDRLGAKAYAKRLARIASRPDVASDLIILATTIRADKIAFKGAKILGKTINKVVKAEKALKIDKTIISSSKSNIRLFADKSGTVRARYKGKLLSGVKKGGRSLVSDINRAQTQARQAKSIKKMPKGVSYDFYFSKAKKVEPFQSLRVGKGGSQQIYFETKVSKPVLKIKKFSVQPKKSRFEKQQASLKRRMERQAFNREFIEREVFEKGKKVIVPKEQVKVRPRKSEVLNKFGEKKYFFDIVKDGKNYFFDFKKKFKLPFSKRKGNTKGTPFKESKITSKSNAQYTSVKSNNLELLQKIENVKPEKLRFNTLKGNKGKKIFQKTRELNKYGYYYDYQKGVLPKNVDEGLKYTPIEYYKQGSGVRGAQDFRTVRAKELLKKRLIEQEKAVLKEKGLQNFRELFKEDNFKYKVRKELVRPELKVYDINELKRLQRESLVPREKFKGISASVLDLRPKTRYGLASKSIPVLKQEIKPIQSLERAQVQSFDVVQDFQPFTASLSKTKGKTKQKKKKTRFVPNQITRIVEKTIQKPFRPLNLFKPRKPKLLPKKRFKLPIPLIIPKAKLLKKVKKGKKVKKSFVFTKFTPTIVSPSGKTEGLKFGKIEVFSGLELRGFR